MNKDSVQSVVVSGGSLGVSLAVVLSYAQWQSVGWAIINGMFGWFYVIYYVLTR